MSSSYFGQVKFLHCMQKREYLDQALSEGLMFTDHPVSFKPSGNIDKTVVPQIIQMVSRKLKSLGTTLEGLPSGNEDVIFRVVGTMKGSIPMLCFSEIHPGSTTAKHGFQFGRYGVTVKREWLDRVRADRVLYVGEDSAVSLKLWRCLSAMHIGGLYITPCGEALFESKLMESAIELLSFCETRANSDEAEWRLVGDAGFWGTPRQTGTRVTLQMGDLMNVFVSAANEVVEVERMVSDIGVRQGSSTLPSVTTFPDSMPVCYS